MTAALPRFSLLLFLAMAFGMFAALMPALEVPLSMHALERHGQDAVSAKECLQRGDALHYWNPLKSRHAVACWLEDQHRWGIVILDAALIVITAFVTNKWRKKKWLDEYMNRKGYQPDRSH